MSDSRAIPLQPHVPPHRREDWQEELAIRLAQAEETIHAIGRGEVDAVVVNGPQGPKVYTLEGAEHPYRVLVEQMHEGTVTLDREGLILYSNPQFAAMVGVPADSATGTWFSQFLASDEAGTLPALLEAAVVRGHSSGQVQLLAADGSSIPVRLSLTVLHLPGLRNISILVTDLREQLRNEAIVKEEQLSRLILEQAGESIVVIDPAGMIIRHSNSARNLAGNCPIFGRFDAVFPLSVSGTPLTSGDILSAARRGERIRSLETSMRQAGGRISALLVSASPLWSEPDQLLGCVITLTDITERKLAEEALLRQTDELARSNSDLRQFAYSAGHDLREPLRNLAVFSELLQKRFSDKLGGEGARLVQHAVDSAHRMDKLLHDLLAYIQAADAPQEAPALVDANEVARKMLADFEQQIAECGAQIECEPLPRLAMHEVHLVQLLQNLTSNALKYRSEAPPRIRIAAERVKGYWRFSVEDNGIGISPEYQGQVFGVFQRLHGGGKYSGSGIGLAICQKIVQRYGGRIWVESEPGRGSKFLFTLPAAG